MSNNSPNLPLPADLPPSQGITAHLQIDDVYAGGVASDRLVTAVETTLYEANATDVELTLVISDDDRLRQLNRDFRDIDEPTDVLSFPAQGAREGVEHAFASLPEMSNYLGDIIISYPTASRQAMAAGHAVGDELCLLAVHGTLHLLGYDHGSSAEEASMWAAQASVLTRLGIDIAVQRYLPDAPPSQ